MPADGRVVGREHIAGLRTWQAGTRARLPAADPAAAGRPRASLTTASQACVRGPRCEASSSSAALTAACGGQRGTAASLQLRTTRATSNNCGKQTQRHHAYAAAVRAILHAFPVRPQVGPNRGAMDSRRKLADDGRCCVRRCCLRLLRPGRPGRRARDGAAARSRCLTTASPNRWWMLELPGAHVEGLVHLRWCLRRAPTQGEVRRTATCVAAAAAASRSSATRSERAAPPCALGGGVEETWGRRHEEPTLLVALTNNRYSI